MEAVIHHSANLKLDGDGVFRTAVRAVVFRNSEMLLVHSLTNGDYKFPGGGEEEGEDHEDALRRELMEECGLTLKSVRGLIGTITEYDRAREDSKDFFKMDSFYYECTVQDTGFGVQTLDKYETELRFSPRWVTIEEAIAKNEEIMRSGKVFPRWTKRDTLFLKYYAQNLDRYRV